MERMMGMQIYIVLTERCNLNCNMCIRGEKKYRDISLQELKDIKFFDNVKGCDVVLTGGEPMLYENIYEIAHEMARNARKVIITTNGTINLDIKKISEIENLFIQVSLDGTEKIHDSIRGKDSFKKTVSTIRKLDINDVAYSVASVINRKNKDDLDTMLDLLKKFNNMRYWKVSYEMPFGRSNFDNMMSSEEWNSFVDTVVEKARIRVKIKKLYAFDLYSKRKVCNNINPCRNCGSASQKVYIYPDLKVYPCTCLKDFMIGDLHYERLKDILVGDSAYTFINYKINRDSPCIECKYINFCRGGCIGMSYHVFKKIGYGDIRCPMVREYYEKNILL